MIGTRKREHDPAEVEEEANLRKQVEEDSRRIEHDDVLFGDGLLYYADVAHEVVDALIKKIGGQPNTFKLKNFDVLSSRALAPVVRSLEVDGVNITPLVQGLLWAAMTKLANDRGGTLAMSFKLAGLHDEALMPTASAALGSPAPPGTADLTTALREAFPKKKPKGK